LFVCMGNICRSPAAEGVFRKLAAEAGRGDEFEIDSAGTAGYHIGQRADARMRSVASGRGYELESRARRLESDDFHRFDWIVAMDDENFADISALDPGARARVVRMVDYCQGRSETRVPDPYYGGEEGFHEVLDILEDACAGLLRRV
ncbi:MAG: low molecular weight protein-tyrosine-phosphatase, partial [Xanthomonadales bacterium]|nr:low molecular weight protein-tyrosine-phosphatase [Xanthomonadales bacterium]